MPRTTATFTAFFISTSAILLTADVSHAQAPSGTCVETPVVTGWHKSNKVIQAHVARKLKGDWGRYVKRWEQYAAKMAAVYDKGGSVKLRSRATPLSGAEFADYIGDIYKKVAVIRCLQEAASLAQSKGGPANDEFAVPSALATKCPAIPEVAWWGDLDHAGVVDLVAADFGGNWDRYINSLDAEFQALMSRFEKSETVDVKVNALGFSLEGEEIALYVVQLNQLIAAAHCMRNNSR